MRLRFTIRDTLTPAAARASRRMPDAVRRGKHEAALILKRTWRAFLGGSGGPTTLGKRTGALQDSIREEIGPTGDAIVGTDHPGARIHEYGGVIVPVRATFLRFEIGGRVIYTKRVRIPKRPHLQPSFEAARPAMIRAMRAELRRALHAK